jgi:hypothetical protein
VIAEGVETLEQKSYLQNQHCSEGQCYLFSRPVAAAQFANPLRAAMAKLSTIKGPELVVPLPAGMEIDGSSVCPLLFRVSSPASNAVHRNVHACWSTEICRAAGEF